MLKNFSFSKKFIVILGLSTILIIGSISITSYWMMQHYLTQNIEKELLQLTESTHALVQTAVNVSIRNYLRGVAEKARLMVSFYYQQAQQGKLTNDEAYTRMKTLLLDPAYGKIGETGYLAGVNGKGVLEIHPVSEGVDASSHDFMKQATTMKNGYLEYPWKNVGEERERAKVGWLSYFEPWDLIVWASSYKSEFTALVDVHDFKQQVEAIKIGETGYAYVMDSKGKLIVHPSLAGQNLYDSQDANGQYFIRDMCTQKNGQFVYSWRNPDEKAARKKLVYFKYLDDLDWIVVCGVYLDELYRPLRTGLYTILGVSGALLAGVTMLSIILGKSLAKPVMELEHYMSAVGDGDLQVQAVVRSRDEIGGLAQAFNQTITRLRTLIGQVQQSGIQITSSTTELSATARQQEAIVANQADSTNRVLQSVSEISAVTAELVETMKGVASETMDASAGGWHEKTDLARMEEAMQQMERASTGISGRLATINEKADNITTVVTTITKVADQTNLLSLNAAIEAEKAGEFGRGFTVVAREIRRLADQTAIATLDIERMVKEMQSAVASGVMEMDKFIAEVRRSADDVRNVSAKLAVIIKQVQALSPRFEDVNVVMTNLGDETQQTRVSLHETYSAIEQLNDAAKNLQQEVLRFKVN